MTPEAAAPQNESPVVGTPIQKDSDLPASVPEEIGGRGGLDPTRYGDWEKNGRCIDF
jgi:hypothetical protein